MTSNSVKFESFQPKIKLKGPDDGFMNLVKSIKTLLSYNMQRPLNLSWSGFRYMRFIFFTLTQGCQYLAGFLLIE